MYNYGLEVARGNVPGVEGFHKFGNNLDVDTTSCPEDLWSGGGLRTPPTQARIHDVTCADPRDTAGGDGANAIQIYGLDADGLEISELLPLNGATTTTTLEYLDIPRAFVTDAGIPSRNIANYGDITLTAQVDGTVTAHIRLGEGSTLQAIYRVPANKDLYITSGWGSLTRPGSASQAQAETRLRMRDAANPRSPWTTKKNIGMAVEGSSPDQMFIPPVRVPAGWEVCMTVISVTDNNMKLNAGFDGYLVTL
jgi:hypothetical protein